MVAAEAKTKHVLIVEDDRDIREALAEFLADEGFPSVQVPDGGAALERLRRGGPRPGVILLDLMMPGMDGFQFRAEQLRDPELASIPVLILSAGARARQAAADLGAAGFVAKPVDLSALLAQLEKYLSGPEGGGADRP